MSVKYRDYYEILGVERGASAEEIRKAYLKLVKKHHPDVTKGGKKNEDKIKEINEAYEVLGDAGKRKKYDMLGANWKPGMDFNAPPGWNPAAGMGGGQSFSFEDLGGGGGDFSDFFRMLFGGGGAGMFGGGFPGGFSRGGASAGGGRRKSQRQPYEYSPTPGNDVESEIELSLEAIHAGGRTSFTLQTPDGSRRSIDVTIPAGVADGSRIRLSGQGEPGQAGGPAGDLYLRVRIAPHSVFKVDGTDVTSEAALAPWEAALGGRVQIHTLDGPVDLAIPPGTSSGRRLRLRGKGLRRREGGRGDHYVVARIVVPAELAPRERELFEQLAQESHFRPRGEKS